MTLEILNNFNIEQFQNDLIGWFEEEQRDLPWRKNKDPYRVWVSEIMLQQPANAGDIRDVGSIPGLGRSPGDGPLIFLSPESHEIGRAHV